MKIALPKAQLPRRVLAVTALLVAVATVVAGRERPAIELPARAALQPARAAAGAMPDIDLAKLERREAAAPQNDPFAARSFAPPPAPRARAAADSAPSAPPSAPPLPFVYAGKVIAEGETELFVMRGDELIAVAVGQRIDGEYRVDAVSDSSIRFTYLPLNAQQSLELEEAGG
jgi:hypothetical protein